MEIPALVGLVVLGTSIWTACDAQAQRVTTDGKPYQGWNGAGVWFFCCLSLWIVAFPYYLSRRSTVLARRASGILETTETGSSQLPKVLLGALLAGLLFMVWIAWYSLSNM